ncbi:MAG: hypothetical protein HFJ55_00285 [Clostridia bacterium]|jgi:type II secretory pathway pseudopilin PulG|nr:hypothetical protein [Clostridia bacterium]
MKNQNGITLVALVVTIIVLLILAGTSIAMLSGDNGIITNAQKANYANTEGEVMDKVKLAYNTINTEIRVKLAVDDEYVPADNVSNLALLVAKDLGSKATSFTTSETIGNYTVAVDGAKITVTYDDGKIFTGTTDTDKGKFKQIKYEFTVAADGVSMTADYTRQTDK